MIGKELNGMETRFTKLINSKIKELNLTKREVAEHINISESMLSLILSGKRKIDLDKLTKLSSYLDIDLKTLAVLAEEDGVISGSVTQLANSITSSVGGIVGAGVAGGGLGYLLGGPWGAIIGAKTASSIVKDSVFKSAKKSDSKVEKNIIYAPPVQEKESINSSAETQLDELSLKQLKELAEGSFRLDAELNRLRDYRAAIDYSLKGLVSDEFIARLIQYIEFEIDVQNKTKQVEKTEG